MAEAQINELFEEAIGRCEELSDDAQTAGDAIESMLDSAQDLADRLASEGEETRRALQTLTGGLQEAEAGIEGAIDGAKAGLDGLVSKASEVQSAVGEAVTRIKDALEELDSLREELRGRLEQQSQDAAGDVEQIAERIASVQEGLSTRIEEAGDAVKELTDAVTEAQEQWGEKRDALLESIVDLERDSRAATEKYASEIEDILDNQRISVLVRHLANDMLIGKHNEAIDVLGQRFEEEVPDALPDRLQPLAAAVTELKELCAQHQSALQQKADEVRARVDKAAGVLEGIMPALESAQQIG